MEKYLAKMQNELPKANMRIKAGKFAGIIGLTSNLLLAFGKVILGFFTGSVSILADGVNNFGDGLSSLLTLIGFAVAGKPADTKHPYGHERFETISGLFISIIVTFVGLQFLKTSLERIIDPVATKISWLVLLVLLISIGVKFWQAWAYRKIGEKITSETLLAAATDSVNDCLTTGVVLLSAAVQMFTSWTIDGYVGLLLAAYILYSGIKLLKEFVDSLLGEVPAEEKIVAIEKQLKSYPKILGFHDLNFHSYGQNHQFATVHIEVDDRYSLERAHDMIDIIEKDFLETLNIQLVCHVDPVDVKNARRQKIRKSLRKFLRYLDDDLTLHDLRLSQDADGEHLSFDVVIPNKSHFTDEELLYRIKKYCLAEFKLSDVEIVFDHNYLLQN
ncbi:cation diffusion facilitator family transporter [Enterococcus timonensis]|uniref:cation diffusion facilitator family transporter n=1 Tax=Enterococcus timonensis TaxID=1852364 RepID=UPI0008D9A75A|nr:cation diffusion facilitator family transporter [Enterococcus timonensis]